MLTYITFRNILRRTMRALTNLEYALLGLVRQRPQSGYELCKTFESTPMGHYSASPGSIYPALNRLEKRALVDGTVEREASLRPRKVYALTAEGKAMLGDWLLRPVTRDDVVRDSDGLMLRFGFMGEVAGKRDVLRFLHELVTETRAVIQALAEHHRDMPARSKRRDGVATGYLALGFGIESYRGLVRWAEKSIKAIENAK